MKDSTHTFTSRLKRIADFLYLPENINHKDVVYMNFSKETGIFEDKSSGSHIYLEFTDDEEVSKILYLLQGEDGIVHRWVRMFQARVFVGFRYRSTQPTNFGRSRSFVRQSGST